MTLFAFQDIVVKPDTTAEKTIFLRRCLCRKEIILSMPVTTIDKLKKQQAWEEIAADLNAAGAVNLGSKSHTALSHQWCDMRRRTPEKRGSLAR